MDLKRRIKLFLGRNPFIYNLFRKIYRVFVPGSTPSEEERVTQMLQEQIMCVLGEKQTIFFVQVGSNDGVQGDPLHNLIIKHLNWIGIFIEPVRFLFERLKQNYAGSERFIFLNVAIGIEKGTKKFYYVSENAKAELGAGLPLWYDQLGSFDKAHIVKHLNGILEPYIIEENVQCVSLQEILDEKKVSQIDLFHIDTEGFDYKILSQMDFSKLRPSVILYEQQHLPADEVQKAKSLLEASGYDLRQFGGDTLAVLRDLL